MTSFLIQTILSAFLFVQPLNQLHPFFVSVTEIEHNAKEKTLEVSCKIFTDDFEKTLRMHHAERIDLLNPAQKNNMSKFVQGYIQQHLKIAVNDRPVTMQFIGYEQQQEAIISYFEVTGIEKAGKIQVTDNLLYEYSLQQLGIIHAIVNGERKSVRLNNPEQTASFTF
jgi:hypothetical protein